MPKHITVTDNDGLASNLESAAEVTTLHSADHFPILDSTDSYALSWITYALLTTTLIDDIGAAGYLPPSTFAMDDFQVGDGAGAWIKKTLAETQAILSVTPQDGWIPITDTWTRTGNYTFTVTGNQTATYRKGTKVRYKDGGSYEYGVIASSSYSSSTTITLITNSDYAMAATTITDTYISFIENPEGFPYWFNYSPSYSCGNSMTYTSVTTDVAKWSVSGKMITVLLRAFGTIGGTPYIDIFATAPVNCATPLDTALVGNTYDSGNKAGIALFDIANQKLRILKYDSSNWGTGSTKYILISGAYEF